MHTTIQISSNMQPTQHTSSSEPSGQSRSPSQRHLDVMHKLSEQLNSEPGAHGVFGQFFSSELSPQSLSRSHIQRFWMHFPLAQVNSSERHVSSGHSQEITNKSCCLYCTSQWNMLYCTGMPLLICHWRLISVACSIMWISNLCAPHIKINFKHLLGTPDRNSKCYFILSGPSLWQ